MRHLLATILLALASSASLLDETCPQAPSTSVGHLDWSDGEFRICAPSGDTEGRRYPADLELSCRVFIDAVEVATARVRPGRVMFELSYHDEQIAREAINRAIQKLPIKARFVKREEGF